jgi:hypothetical protein
LNQLGLEEGEMLRKIVSRILFALIFLILSMSWTLLSNITVANPIPLDRLIMPEEYIDAEIYLIDDAVWAKVNGTYPFYTVTSLENTSMYYPVPSDVEKVAVEMDNMTLSWNYTYENYPTVIGVFPMINWTIKPVPNNFTIRTHYEHPVPIMDGSYMFLYAMGTGRYLRYYAKETTAYVTVSVGVDIADDEDYINVYTIGYNKTTGDWIWKQANYSVSQLDDVWVITFSVVSEEFHPLVEDFLIAIRAPPSSPDINGDGIVNMGDVIIAVDAFGAYPTHPRWNPLADINRDNRVTMGDIIIILANFGKHYP